ncbi:MAG: hypothetical protein Q9159_007599, partial [Coniocarpon cinnabarinum]
MQSAPAFASINPANKCDRARRHALIHLLAVGSASITKIRRCTNIEMETLKKLLDSVAEKAQSGSEAAWSLTTKRHKELDPWAFPYKLEDRKAAVENAARSFDKMRLNPHDPLWQRLLPVHERGKGKTLSKLNKIAADHRKFLGGISNQERSHPSSPAHSQSAEPSDAESAGSMRKPAKKQDLIANAKKRLAGNSKIDKPIKPEKEAKAAHTKSIKPRDKRANGSSTSPVNGKKRKVLSNELVHSSDDDSVRPHEKRPKHERALSESNHAKSTGSLNTNGVTAKTISSVPQHEPSQTSATKPTKQQPQQLTPNKVYEDHVSPGIKSNLGLSPNPKPVVKRQAGRTSEQGPPTKRTKVSQSTPAKRDQEGSQSRDSGPRRSNVAASSKQKPLPSKDRERIALENRPSKNSSRLPDSDSADRTAERRSSAQFSTSAAPSKDANGAAVQEQPTRMAIASTFGKDDSPK